MLNDSARVLRHSTPVLSDSGRVLSHSAPVLNDSGWVLRHSAPVLSDSGRVLRHSTPVLCDSGRGLGHSAPVLNDSGRVLRHSGRVQNDSGPVRSKQALGRCTPLEAQCVGIILQRKTYYYSMKINTPILLICCALLMAGKVQAQTAATIALKDAAGNTMNTFSTLQSAYNAIPSPMTQAYTIEIDGGNYDTDQETLPIVFTEKTGASAAHTITIRPKAQRIVDVIGSVLNSPLLILDGADWVSFEGPASSSFYKDIRFTGYAESAPGQIVRAPYPVVALRNGASHNRFYGCSFQNGSGLYSIHDAPALQLEGTNNGKGNDSNSVSYSSFQSSDNLIASAGTVAAPNTGLIITRNNFRLWSENAIDLVSGTAGCTISHNGFLMAIRPEDSVASRSIIIRQLADTNRIEGNRITFSNSGDSSMVAIDISNSGATAGYALITNNAITVGRNYGLNTAANGVNEYYTDNIIDLTGISISGAGPVQAGIFHNTIRFNRNYDSTLTNAAYSNCIKYSGTNSNNSISLQNNLLINERQGGRAGSRHLALNLVNSNGIFTDYNTYTRGASIQAGNVLYASYATWQQANSSLDIHSNDSIMLFETDLARANILVDSVNSAMLSAAMYLNPSIRGTQLASVLLDMNQVPRLYPYKGCFEILPSCSTPAIAAGISGVPGSVCAGSRALLHYEGETNSSNILHQWQQRGIHDTAFTDIPGETKTDLLPSPLDSTVYRVKDSCVAGNNAAYYTPSITIGLKPAGSIGTLSETHTDSNYIFRLTGSTGFTGYSWDMGDGYAFSTPDTAFPYSYAMPGTYHVAVISYGGCISDTARLTVNVWATGITQLTGGAQLMVYPNPANNAINLKLSTGNIQQLMLTDMMGRVVARQSAAGSNAVLNVSNQPAGYYLLRIITDKGTVSRPVSVVH